MNDFCIACEDREDCEGVCVDLNNYMEGFTTGSTITQFTMSTDFLDAKFSDPDTEETRIEREQRLRKERKERGKAVRNIVRHFANLTDEEGKSLKFFLIWKMSVEEKLKHWEIAEIIGISRQRISQILDEIKVEIN